MYLVSFFKNLFRKSNIGTIIFFLLNFSVIIAIFASSGTETLTTVLLIYLASVLLALSPVGEFVLAVISGARKITRMDMLHKVEPSVLRIQKKAKVKTPDLADKFNLKVVYDPNPNAFALGRRTICVTEGLLELPDEMIEGIIAHEVGHLALKHTDIQLLIGSGNFLVTGFILMLKAISAIITGAATTATVTKRSCSTGCLCGSIAAFCAGIVWVWTKFCMLFLMWSSRENEYEADKYAKEIGFGYELALALDTIGTGQPQNSFLNALYSTHPETHDRIGRLQAMGVPYSKY